MERELSEREFREFIEVGLSNAGYFSCVIQYKSRDAIAWYTALRIGEIISNYYKAKMSEVVKIHLNLQVIKVIDKINEMMKNDVLLITVDNKNIKPLSQYLITELLIKKKNLIFISKRENPLSKPFKEITNVVIDVYTLSQNKINCIININEIGDRGFKLTLPNRSLIENYQSLRTALIKESIRRQVPELEDQE